ncbi:MAG: ATP-binding protein [Solirubrobacterales bacterium]|nr:ATP-binding protein [Solirubrobacterales bacterium]
MPDGIYKRHVSGLVAEALDYSPAVFLMGARQVGKSTLVERIAAERSVDDVVTLDDRSVREAARADPAGFVAARSGSTVIDEVQRVPDLLLAIKRDIDRERRPGRFLLTGSANVLTAPAVNDALTGRAALVTLWPLAQSELSGSGRNLVDALFAGAPPNVSDAPIGRDAFVEPVVKGGYPEAVRLGARARRRLLTDYVRSTLERDLRDIATARNLDAMPRLLRLIASRAGSAYNVSSVTKALGLARGTVHDYTRLLETVFLVKRIPAWRPGLGGREIHAPKLYLVDSGLHAAVLGADVERIAGDDQLTGPLLESFVAMEIARHVDWAETAAAQYHYRDRREEIDVVLEAASGDLVAVEVKASATVRPSDWRPIRRLRDARGSAFRAGLILYAGAETVALSDRIWAVPISGLWL